MASLFGGGYGAGKMFEGAASGMLKGRLYNDQMAQQATENNRADETLGMQKQRLDLAAQEEERQRQAIDQKITFESFGKAFDAGSKAPVGARAKTYEAVYKALNPQGAPPPVEFSEAGDEAKLTLSDGTVLAGGVEYIKQASQALATAPGQAKEIMQTALKTGVLRVEKQAQTDKGQGGNTTPYSVPVQTAQGIYRFDTRTGQLTPANVGDGMVVGSTSDPNLQSQITGQKEQAKLQVEKRKLYPKARESLKSAERQWDNVQKQIDDALGLVSPFTAGFGSVLSSIPATSQKRLATILDTIRANVGFDKLQDMRQNSPTGGALGQVSDMENKLLQAVLGSLDQGLSAADLAKNLQNIKTILAQLKAQKQEAFNTDFSGYDQDIQDFTQGGVMGQQNNAQPAISLPPAAVSQLQPGKITTFRNGQRWTMGADGQPQQVQ